jgi:magnesium transporter
VVLEGERLAGIVPVERLLSAPPDVSMADVMDSAPPLLHAETPREEAAYEMVRRGESGLALIHDGRRFAGVIPAAAMLPVLLEEHDEDLARLGGYLASTRRARGAAEEDVRRRLLHRLPWLMVGLLGAMVSAVLVGAFEEQLDSVVLLALFLPAVVYMAGAVGAQTQTVLIRGLSAGVRISEVLLREALTGVGLGLMVGATFYPFALLGWGDGEVASAVSLALFASCAMATLVAMALPMLLQRLGTDPAFGSGPVATILQDLIAIVVYLGIAAAIVT